MRLPVSRMDTASAGNDSRSLRDDTSWQWTEITGPHEGLVVCEGNQSEAIRISRDK
jgi:hypothetical protein